MTDQVSDRTPQEEPTLDGLMKLATRAALCDAACETDEGEPAKGVILDKADVAWEALRSALSALLERVAVLTKERDAARDTLKTAMLAMHQCNGSCIKAFNAIHEESLVRPEPPTEGQ